MSFIHLVIGIVPRLSLKTRNTLGVIVDRKKGEIKERGDRERRARERERTQKSKFQSFPPTPLRWSHPAPTPFLAETDLGLRDETTIPNR